MYVTEFGMVRLVRLEQFTKARWFILVKELGKVRLLRPEHP